ncbi:MAG: type I polyketide synthase, partial [Proteobacteria bacterium]|nr:type I polyketide synthase [Pseudomonadota bacterium]
MKKTMLPVNKKGQEPIAIVGIGCRLPGGINSPDSFWEFLKKGGDGISEIPPDRWNIEKFYHPDRTKIGKLNVKKGGFLDQIKKFDAEFFGISPREAALMDPQQRLMLEVTWEALENGGLVPANLRGSKTGVYIGLFVHDYENMHSSTSEYELQGAHSGTGLSATVVANRISFCFDFNGPSMVIDSACSSSLGGVHYACRDLWSKETELAMVGGVNIMSRPEMTMILCKASMLSPDGYCKAFDASANGYVRSEAATAVILKPLSAAVRDNNVIYATILSSVMNQDGFCDGLTVPNGVAQESLIRQAIEQAGVSAKDIQYVEAHGTGTEVGDPIEGNSIGSVLSKDRPKGEYCVIGSVKSNIGHTESAAGLVGLIKTALMLKFKKIPPNLHFNTPNPKIPFDQLKIRLPIKLENWQSKSETPRLAGINSFGFGGTNAHAILQAYEPKDTDALPDEQISHLVPFSAKSDKALDDTIVGITDSLKAEKTKSVPLADIAYSASLRKSHHNHRLAVVTKNKDDLLYKLEQYLYGDTLPGVASGVCKQETGIKSAFVFSGMGQQWIGMGKHLFESEPVFADVIKKCDAHFQNYDTDWSLREQLCLDDNSSRIHETQVAQPCIFSLQIALFALWKSHGFIPDFIVGHSVGEIAACYAAGILSLDDSTSIAYHRSRLQQQTAGQGKMLAVGLSESDMTQRLKGFSSDVAIGAVNSGTSVTLSGNEGTLKSIANSLDNDQVFNRFLKVEVPYHSPVMDQILPDLKISLAHLCPTGGDIPLISTVTGEPVEGKNINASYWQQNVRKPVLFAKAISSAIRSNVTHFIEIGAHPVLSTSVMECLNKEQTQGKVYPSLRRKESNEPSLWSSMAELYCQGYHPEWSQKYKAGQNRFIGLPSYPWQQEEFWNESESSKQHRIGKSTHPLLGVELDTAQKTWHNTIDLDQLVFLKDHIVQSSIVFPGSGYVEMALAAGRVTFERDSLVVSEFKIEGPLVFVEKEPKMLQLTLDGSGRFRIYSKLSKDQKVWTEHASGFVAKSNKPTKEGIRSFEEIKNRCIVHYDKSEVYKKKKKKQ